MFVDRFFGTPCTRNFKGERLMTPEERARWAVSAETQAELAKLEAYARVSMARARELRMG